MAIAPVRIGTSGWNYPKGKGSWNGVFYPPARGRAPDFDELGFYAEHFDTVEVNSTFYGTPKPAAAQAWARRTPANFEFSVKLYQKFTHPGMFQQRLRTSLRAPGDAAPDVDAALLSALASPNQADIDEFRRGIDPLAAAGKLGALLAQFPPSFTSGSAQQDYVIGLRDAFKDYQMAIELRHRSWSDDVAATLALLNSCGAAWVQIDEPKFRFSIRQNHLPNVTSFYYMRLHGRNAAQWWRSAASEDRYNYLYSDEELREFSDTIAAARRIVKKVYLYTNNHFSAKSVANAATIKRQLGEPLDGDYPETFTAKYPHVTAG